MEPTRDQIAESLMDVLEGNYAWYEIQENTGLSEARCKEISEIYVTLHRLSGSYRTLGKVPNETAGPQNDKSKASCHGYIAAYGSKEKS